MNARSNVVPEMSGVTEDQFHGAMVAGLGRAETKVGSKALAFVMDVTTKQLRNIFGGSAPHPKRLWDARKVCPSALDDIADLYDCKIVSKASACDVDDLKVLIATVNLKLTEYAHPESAAGEKTAHSEFLDGEDLMRELNEATARWLETCRSIRRPRSVAQL